MEIKNINNSIIKAYKSVAAPKSPKEKSSAGTRTSGDNFDKFELEFERSITAAKTNIASSLDAEANTARIEQLQKQYSGENVPTSAEQVAQAIVE